MVPSINWLHLVCHTKPGRAKSCSQCSLFGTVLPAPPHVCITSVAVSLYCCTHAVVSSSVTACQFLSPSAPLFLTRRRRIAVSEFLLTRDFNLAVAIISLLSLPAVQIYASVAASLARQLRHAVLFNDVITRLVYMLPPGDMDEVRGTEGGVGC